MSDEWRGDEGMLPGKRRGWVFALFPVYRMGPNGGVEPLKQLFEKGTHEQLGSDKDAAYDHHTCAKESASDLAFAEKHACPDDRQNGTQLEQGGDIPDQAKRKSGEAKEWSNTCKKHCQRYCTWMSIQSLPPTLLTSLSLLTRGPKRCWCEKQHHEKGAKQRNDWTAWRGHMLDCKLLKDGGCAPQGGSPNS